MLKVTLLRLLAALVPALPAAALAQAVPAEEPAVQAVSKCMPAVVNINTERVIKRTVRDPYDDFFNQFYGRQRAPTRTLRQKVQSLGSGFLVDPSGFIVTNEHVVERAADLKISVTTHDGKTYTARYIAGAPESDLAFIKIDNKEPLPFIDLEELSPNLLGQTVLVLGNPLGYGSSVARGILSARNRTIAMDEVEYKDLLQTDAAINPGNSGGPLVDIAGRLVGVSSVKMAFTPQGVPTQGLGFAIPAELVRTKVADFRRKAASQKDKPLTRKAPESTSLARRHFGLQLQDLTPELSETFGVEEGAGVLVADVEAGSPAEVAGIQRGLMVVQVGRFAVGTVRDLERLLEPISEGSIVDFTVASPRGLRRETQTVALTAR